MQVRYNVPDFSSKIAAIAGEEPLTGYLECYMKGLQDAGTIEAYDIKAIKGRFWSLISYNVLTIELVDETRREQIDATVRRNYRAKPEPVTQTA